MRSSVLEQATRSRSVLVGGTVIVATVIGLGVGVVTSYLQGVLPASFNFLANSGAVWSLVAFAVVAARRLAPLAAALVGVVVLLSEVLGYYAIASVVRDIATSDVERALWTGTALVLGPVLGLAGHYVRSDLPARRSIALGGVAGLVAGEAFHALLRLHYPVQGWVLLSVAVSLCAPGATSLRRAAAALPAAAIVALAIYVAYGLS